jgi:hypothetical protein
MDVTVTTVILVVYRISIAFSSIVFAWLGYRLLSGGLTRREGEIELKVGKFRARAVKVTAGSVFSLCGMGVLITSLVHPFSIRTPNGIEVIAKINENRASVAAQESEATSILRCYLGVAVKDLPEVWEHANGRGLFREPGQLAEMKAMYDRALADPAVRDRNLRTANQRYASDIAILEGSQPTRLPQLTNHRAKVCEIARR